jgi:hypothetical protein
MIIALRCHRCGAYGQAEGLDVFDAEHQAEAAGWLAQTIGYSGGRVVLIDVCPQCLAARTGAVRESHEATPASRGESTTSIGVVLPPWPGNGVTAGETAQTKSQPANPDPQGAPAPDAAGGSRTTEIPTKQANHTYLSAAPGSDARDLSRRM